MTAPDFVIRTITIDDGGVALEYVAPTNDIKANGVQHNHVLFIPRDDDYDDEITTLEESAVFLLRDVLEDLPLLKSLAKMKQTKDQDEEDDE